MKQFSAQFKKQADRITMRASEARELRERVVSYMEYHPLSKELTQHATVRTSKIQGIPSEAFFAIKFNKVYLQSFGGVFALLCIFAVPLIAEQTLPGDVLYPVKVEFTEELRSTLSFSPYAKVAWETERLERRISEARLLASEGKFTPEAQTQFREAVKTHADTTHREIALLRESDSEEAAIAEITFASALAVQSEVLEGHIENDTPSDSGDTTAILAVAEVVAQARSVADIAQSEAPASYEKLLATIELESTHAYELFTSVQKEVSTDETVDIERRLSDIKRKVSEAISIKEGSPVQDSAEVAGIVALMTQTAPTEDDSALFMATSVALSMSATSSATGTTELAFDESSLKQAAFADIPAIIIDPAVAEAEAVEFLRLTLTDIQKLINYLTNIDVRENVSIESLVPVKLTAQERAMEIKALYDETQKLLLEVTERKLTTKLRGKVHRGQTDVTSRLLEVTARMEIGQLDDARVQVEEARAIALDLLKLVAEEPLKVDDEDDVAVSPEGLETPTTTTEASITQ